MKNSKTILLFLLSVCAMNLFAQTNASECVVFTLDSVLHRIELNNPMLKMYDEEISAVNNYSQMAKGWMPPTLSTGPWQAPYKNFKDGMWMFTGEQMIPNPAKQKANYKYMGGMVPVEQYGKATKQNEMFAMAKQNYSEWSILKRKYDVLIQTDSLLNYMVEIAQFRYTYNKEKISNIYKAKADLFELRNMESMALGDMKMKNVELNTLMNVDKYFVFDIDTTLEFQNYEFQNYDTLLVSSARSDIKQFDASINLLKLKQDYERSKRYPDFGISLSHMQSLNMMPNQFSAMGMVTIPIAPWASKEFRSNIKGMDNSVNSLAFQKQALLNEVTGNLASLQIQIIAIKDQLNNYNRDIIPAYFKSYQTSAMAYEQNTEDLFVVLDGLKMYRMAQLNELDKLNSLLKLQIDYEKQLEVR